MSHGQLPGTHRISALCLHPPPLFPPSCPSSLLVSVVLRFGQFGFGVSAFVNPVPAPFTSGDDLLFQRLLPAILRDRGESYRLSELFVGERVWKDFHSSECFERLGQKCVTSRFFNIASHAELEDKSWHTKLYGQLSACMLLGLLDHKSQAEFSGCIRRTQVAFSSLDGDAAGRMSMKQSKEHTQAIKETAVNYLQLSAMLYSDSDNQRIVRIFIQAVAPCKRWHSEANRCVRSVGECVEWSIMMSLGGWAKHVSEGLRGASDPSVVEYLGFRHLRELPCEERHDQSVSVQAEQDMAALLGRMLLSFAGHRVRRLLKFSAGWPHREVLLASDDLNIGQRAIDELRGHWEIYIAMQRSQTVAAGFLKRRSIFETMPCKQLVAVLEQCGWRMSARIREWALARSQHNISTQIVEDEFAVMKRSSEKAANKSISDMRRWLAPIQRRMASERHRFFEVPMGLEPIPAAAQIDDEVFQAKVQHTWRDLQLIKGTSSSPSWYSPAGRDLEVPFSDLHLAKFLYDTGRSGSINLCWQAQLLSGVRNVVIRDKQGSCCRGRWVIPLAFQRWWPECRGQLRLSIIGSNESRGSPCLFQPSVIASVPVGASVSCPES